ncbi:MAG: peroxidase family protein [Planctomycetota bacterium]
MRTHTLTAFAALAFVSAAGTAQVVEVELTPDVPTAKRRSSLVQRAPLQVRTSANIGGGMAGPAIFPNEFRTIEGVGNNPFDYHQGATATPFIRTVPSVYGGDGSGDVAARLSGPSARAVSNAIHTQVSSVLNPKNASDYLWQWGQFLDHDIDETPIADPPESLDIAVPAGDAFFDPFNSGSATIALDRSAGVDVDGVREHINNITSYIDGSMVYGSEDDRAHELRSNDGTGRLKTSAGDLMMFNVNGLPNAMSTAPTFFLAGDVRANEQAALAAMHTLWVREHNFWADHFAAALPAADDDLIYESARAIVVAEIQAITYNEFLPLLLGPDALSPYSGYDSSVNAAISNEFANAAFRVGHTMLSGTIMRLDADGTVASEGHLPLRDAFFDPSILVDHGIDSILRGLGGQVAQNIDRFVVDDVRNFLFGPPGSGGFDLASLNIQRGRDHGIGSYNDVRDQFGLGRAASFADVSGSSDVQSALASVYADTEEIDPWTGMLCEDQVAGSLVGPTLQKVLGDQFERLRDGDRFWYESYLPASVVAAVDATTLADVIRRNTDIGSELSDTVFVVSEEEVCRADIDGNAMVNLSDLFMFFGFYASNDDRADLNGDGNFNISDVLIFIRSFLDGC